MRIGVDGFNLAMRNGTGISAYARTLTHCLRALGHEIDVLYGLNFPRKTPPVLAETLFFDNLEQDQNARMPSLLSAGWFAECAGNIAGHQAREIPINALVDSRNFNDRLPVYDRLLNIDLLFRKANRHFNRTGRFLRVKVESPPDIMHWTYPMPIRLTGAKNIYTIHDLVPLRLPFTTLDNKTAHFKLLRAIANSDAGICTVSEASKRDILSFFPQAAARLCNTYQGLKFDPGKMPPIATDAILRISGLEAMAAGGYFLFYGSLEPKKNIGRLIEAILTARPSRPLIVIGAKSWKTETELRFLGFAQQLGCVIYQDYLPEAELIQLIRGARAVLFPSLSEGFGLPVLESLALGTPVLTSREGALPEVAGQAALYADAYDTRSIADGITCLDTDDALCQRLRVLGPLQAEKFSMESYRNKLAAMYRRMTDR